MKPLKKVAALAVVLVGIFAFSKANLSSTKPSLNLDTINVIETLSKQQFECRPTSDFMFYVETDLVKKIRGANNVNARVYILDKVSGRKALLADENIQIKKFEGAIELKDHSAEGSFKNEIIQNGDVLIGSSEKAPFTFDELIQFESIYNSYLNSTNKLLRLKRSI
jgi:hypothetical protein